MNKRSKQVSGKGFPAVQYKHDLGQHFLYDTDLLRSLVDKAGVTAADHILEIGAGAGTLTRVLCEKAAYVTAVEVDQALIPLLQLLATQQHNLTIIQSDIRKVDIAQLNLGDGFRVVANLPYSITSQILDLFWDGNLPVFQMSVMVQKEVADKLVAVPGDKAYGLMSVRCRYHCIPEIVAQVPASAFTPPPKVDSAFVNILFRREKRLANEHEKMLWQLVQASYRLRRKTLVNALKTVMPLSGDELAKHLEQMGLPQNVRGEVLSVEQWIDLTYALKSRREQTENMMNALI